MNIKNFEHDGKHFDSYAKLHNYLMDNNQLKACSIDSFRKYFRQCSTLKDAILMCGVTNSGASTPLVYDGVVYYTLKEWCDTFKVNVDELPHGANYRYSPDTLKEVLASKCNLSTLVKPKLTKIEEILDTLCETLETLNEIATYNKEQILRTTEIKKVKQAVGTKINDFLYKKW